MKNNEEQTNYIKTIEDRGKVLEDGERQTIELISNNINHKRAFLGTSMTIAAAVIAGLFILLIGKDLSNSCLVFLTEMSGLGFALFIVTSSIYLTVILAQESLLLDRNLQFVEESKKDFIEKVGISIIDVDSYEKYRGQKYREEKELKRKVRGSHEIWFILINVLFISSFILLLIMFLSPILKLCSTP